MCPVKGKQKNCKINGEKNVTAKKTLVQKVNRIFGLPQFVWPRVNLANRPSFGLSTARCSFQVTHSSPLLLYCPIIPTLLRCNFVELHVVRVSGRPQISRVGNRQLFSQQRETLCCAFRNFQWKRAKFKKYSGAKSPNYAGWELLFKWNFEAFLLDMKLLSFKRKIMCCRLSARLLIHITVLVCSTESKIVCLFQSFCPTAFFQNAIFTF